MESQDQTEKNTASASTTKTKVAVPTDTENCILCFNQLKFFSLGQCGHKNVCHTCTLRMRLIMEDEDCPVCREELEEVLITDDKSFEWRAFTKKVSKRCEEDPEDDTIYYHNEAAKRASL